MKKITHDFETASACDLKKSGAFEYSAHPSAHVLCYCVKSEAEKTLHFLDYYQMKKPFKQLPTHFQTWWAEHLKNGALFSAHNSFFETVIYTNILVKRLGWPSILASQKRCTAAKAGAASLPRSLAGAGEAMRLRVQKDPLGHRAMMKLCKPKKDGTFWTPETAPDDFAVLYRYCKIDVLAEESLDAALPDLIPLEQEIWHLDQKINLRGVCIDRPAVEKISEIMALEAKKMGKELDSLTMGLVASAKSRNQVMEFLALDGLALPDLKAKTVEDFLQNGKATGDAKKLLKLRQALSKSSTAKYLKFDLCSRSDGRARDLYLYCAAGPGRWGGKNIQPQNLPRGIVKDISEAIHQIMTCTTPDLKMLYGENLMPLFSSVIRGMFIASEGKELFTQDFNAIETRVLWWICEHEAGLKMFRDGVDPYKAMASVIFRKDISLISDAERQVGKAAILGLGYQMGPKKFVSSASDVYRIDVTKEVAKLAVTAYRETHWPVPEFWENCNRAAILAVENLGRTYHVKKIKFYAKNDFLHLELPSGRSIMYKSPTVVSELVTIQPDDVETIVNGKIVLVKQAPFSFMAKRLKFWGVDPLTKKWVQETTYGGRIVENIVQGCARDIMAESMLRVEKAGFEVLMHSHDEIVSEALKGEFSSAYYNEIMEALPPWAGGLPMKAAGWTGPRYKKG